MVNIIPRHDTIVGSSKENRNVAIQEGVPPNFVIMQLQQLEQNNLVNNIILSIIDQLLNSTN